MTYDEQFENPVNETVHVAFGGTGLPLLDTVSYDKSGAREKAKEIRGFTAQDFKDKKVKIYECRLVPVKNIKRNQIQDPKE